MKTRPISFRHAVYRNFARKNKERLPRRSYCRFFEEVERFFPLHHDIYQGGGGPGKNADKQILEQEGKGLLEKVEMPTLLVALDRKGSQHSSEEMASLLGKWEAEGRRSVTFLIGGHLGLSDQVIDRADLLLSFSKMTFTHEMARVLLLEQLYRACSIRQKHRLPQVNVRQRRPMRSSQRIHAENSVIIYLVGLPGTGRAVRILAAGAR